MASIKSNLGGKGPSRNGGTNNKLAVAIKSDPKKAAVLTVLVVVMLGMWGKMFFWKGAGPKEAVAATSDELSNKNRAGRGGKEASDALQEWLRAPIAPVNRNLFAVKFDYFPQDASKINQTLVAPSGNGFWDQVAKSMTEQADQNRDRQIRIQNLQIQAAQLRLQSILMGAQPKALIDGELVGEGDVVARFRVSRIEARRIIVEREGIKLEILMK